MDEHIEDISIQNYDSFEKMGLNENILRGIFSYGFEYPSEIQSKAIVPIVKGRDIIAQAQSGTGKTGAFVIGTLSRVDSNIIGCQAMIIVPTRELAMQIKEVCKDIGSYTNIKSILCIGGYNIYETKKELENCASIIIGTPGRIIDMIEKKYLSTEIIRILILDEADELLSDSFVNQMKTIIENIPGSAQICLFSATMPQEVIEITKKFLRDPIKILVKQEELTLDGIKQFYINTENEKWKFETFCDLYNIMSIGQSIVYVNTKQRAEYLRQQLKEKNFPVSIIHSNMRPIERAQIMKNFRNGGTRILISTDLLSRGIDIQQVSIVINYDLPILPRDKESYIHRIGRSGRYGKKGVAINLVTKKDLWKIEELQKIYSTVIQEMPNNINEYLS